MGHAAMAAAHAGNTPAAVAAAHQLLARAQWRAHALVAIDVVPGGGRIDRAVAAGAEIDLGLGGADACNNQGAGKDKFFHGSQSQVNDDCALSHGSEK